jgi:hypothetical protein
LTLVNKEHEDRELDEITLEEAGLVEKQTIKFRFDYGDDWQFVLRL